MATVSKTEEGTSNILAQSLANAGVKYVLGVPGAKIDAVFNALLDHPEIKVITCRHEQNAGFIAAAIGRITGRPGVCIATSGPGTSNLATALMTATTECDPVVALVGTVARVMSTKKTHQSLKATDLLTPVTKNVVAVEHEDQVAEVFLNAFRGAQNHPGGSYAIALPSDVMSGKSHIVAFPSSAFEETSRGPASSRDISQVTSMLEKAKLPVLLLGMRASDPAIIKAVHGFLKEHPMPVTETFQAAGAINRELLHCFFGRVGLFRNQPGDKILAAADLVITVGYDPTEYEPSNWNKDRNAKIVHVDFTSGDFEQFYLPQVELLGSCEETIQALTSTSWKSPSPPLDSTTCQNLRKELKEWGKTSGHDRESGLVHPLHFIRLLREKLSDDTVVTSDVGSLYIWLSRYYYTYKPRTLLVSNGQQTLGVGLPWAIGVSLTQSPPCSEKVVSISGDGGFMFSVQEMATAVQQGCNITHFIWNDRAFNMVEFQEVAKYGRSSGIALGGVDFAMLAESFGAKGLKVTDAGQLESVMQEALAHTGVCVVDVSIDYSDNSGLMAHVIDEHVN